LRNDAAVLASPNFLYRGIWGEARITELELARRLSSFLWEPAARPGKMLSLRVARSC